MLAAEVPSAETIDSGVQMKRSVMGKQNGKYLSGYSLGLLYLQKYHVKDEKLYSRIVDKNFFAHHFFDLNR